MRTAHNVRTSFVPRKAQPMCSLASYPRCGYDPEWHERRGCTLPALHLQIRCRVSWRYPAPMRANPLSMAWTATAWPCSTGTMCIRDQDASCANSTGPVYGRPGLHLTRGQSALPCMPANVTLCFLSMGPCESLVFLFKHERRHTN